MGWVKNSNTKMNIVFGLFMIALPLMAFLAIWSQKQEVVECPLQVRIKNDRQCISLEVVDTVATRTRGLSGREPLPITEGMLFDFTNPGNHCIWMKDMNFSLDIVWLNAKKEITDIRENVSPDTYPNSFCPSQPALYVIELMPGVADRAGLEVGQTIDL